MINKEFVSWEKFEIYIKMIEDWVNLFQVKDDLGAIYALPRGGLPIAVTLSHRLNLPLLMNYNDRKIVTDKKILVVDDIADTGQTLKDFQNDKNVICTIHYHEQSIVKPDFCCDNKNDKWIVYPWERDDSEAVQDYLKS